MTEPARLRDRLRAGTRVPGGRGRCAGGTAPSGLGIRSRYLGPGLRTLAPPRLPRMGPARPGRKAPAVTGGRAARRTRPPGIWPVPRFVPRRLS